MAWFGSAQSFHQACLNELARSLAHVDRDKKEKERQLLSHCPPLEASTSLQHRSLSAVVALGLYALETKDDPSDLIDYLINLLLFLPSSSWQLSTSSNGELLVQQYYHQVSLILIILAVERPYYEDKILKAELTVLEMLLDRFSSLSDDLTCLVVIPSLLGLAQALSGDHGNRRKVLQESFIADDMPGKAPGEWSGKLLYNDEHVEKIVNMLLPVLRSGDAIRAADTAIARFPSLSLQYLGTAVQCSLMILLRDTLMAAKNPLSSHINQQVRQLANDHWDLGTRGLHGIGSRSQEQVLYTVQMLCTVVELMVLAPNGEDEADAVSQRLSSMLTVHTKLNIIVSPLRATILRALAVLAQRFPTLLAGCTLSRYTEFLLSTLLQRIYLDAGESPRPTAHLPSLRIFSHLSLSAIRSLHISRSDAFLVVQEALSETVGSTLLAASLSDDNVITSFIGSLGNKLYTTDARDERALRTAECIIVLLGEVGVVLSGRGHKGALPAVARTLQQRMFRPVSVLDGAIVTELGKMAASSGDTATLDILNQLMGEALGVATTPYPTQGEQSDSHSHIFQPVMNALEYVAVHLKDEEQRAEFLLKVLQSFVQQGIEGKRASDRRDQYTVKASSSSFSLGLLLPVLATLADHMERISQPSSRVIKLFSDFWLYCVLLGFCEPEKGVFPPSWYIHVTTIAVKSPLLIFTGAEKYLDKELELSHPLRKGDISLSELQEARLTLLDTLDRSAELDKLVYRLPFSQCMYLQSIYRLESVRLEKDTRLFPLIFEYLEDKGLQRELWVVMEAIANKLFERLLLLLEAKPAGKEREAELESHACLLLFKFNHIRGRIKKTADSFLSSLVDRFPHLLWSKEVIHTMLDLLQQLSLHSHTLDHHKRMVAVVTLPDYPYQASLPDNTQKRQETIVNFAKRCGQIIDLAIQWAPSETKAILESYVTGEGRSPLGLLHHSGVSLASQQLLSYHQLNTTTQYCPESSQPDCLIDTRSQPISAILLQSTHLGQVTSDGCGQSPSQLTTSCVEKIKNALEQDDLHTITTALYAATALLISRKGQCRTLLHNICHLPIKAFKTDVVTMATHCWTWLIIARPDLEYSFMRELSSSWLWTVTARKGMFAPPTDKLHPHDIKPHIVITEFLSRRSEVFNTRNEGLARLMSQLFHKTLTMGVGPQAAQRQHFTPSVAACAARFKFLTVGVSLLRGRSPTSVMERTLLRERIYNAALDYFCYDPSWLVGDIRGLREAMDALIKFWVAVKDLKNAVTEFASSAVLDSSPSTTIPRNSSFWQALASENTSSQGGWLNTFSSTRTTRLPSSASTLQVGASFAAPGRRATSNVKSKILLKRRNLILALVRHELERFIAWQNSNGAAELSVPGEEGVVTWQNPTQSDRHWQSTVTMAYQSSPHLAFQLVNRFPNVDSVSKEVTRLIQCNPVAFVDIPDAALMLARVEAVERSSPELYHLLYWRNVPPSSTLTFFTRPYSTHPITAQFANKAMRSFKPGEILLYIPQLVQALRHDKLGFARDYLLSAAKSSQLLAHQFLWNMQANMYTDEEGSVKDPVIGTLLEEIGDEILKNLSGAALSFYKREFSFFEKVTDISRIIKPFPKPERRKECLKALQKIKLEPGVYLPSNPDSVLLEIDYQSGRPMQSAAKAPYLARFRVKKCGIAELESLNTQEENAMSRTLAQYHTDQSLWQGSIFKVGDDVRQDMLALQVIQLFKDIYDRLNLDLYLVPYRVVATAAGRGVIECVPDSQSRDQLGKQTQVSLKEYFHSVYGDEDSAQFQQARANFIRSMAAYSIVTYLLQIKDRHNGNIMIDKDGHIIHIDFGFLFESSPGGNLGFETDLKLTEEMLEVMGGKKSDSYKWFVELCVHGFLSIRPYQDQVVAMVTLMLDTGFPCFRGNTIEELKNRFRPQLSDKEAARAIIEIVESSCLNFRTFSYDVIQDVQQKIYYHKKQ